MCICKVAHSHVVADHDFTLDPPSLSLLVCALYIRRHKAYDRDKLHSHIVLSVSDRKLQQVPLAPQDDA